MKSKMALITGINGFIGYHLRQLLLEKHYSVIGVGRREHCSFTAKNFYYESCDLQDPISVGKILDKYKPEYIVHLAAENDVGISWEKPLQTFTTNCLGTFNLLEQTRSILGKQLKRILVAGSAQEYASQLTQQASTEIQENRLTEHSSVEPSNPYGWSKLWQVQISQLYANYYSLPILIARTFNVLGPAQVRGVGAYLATQIIQIERGILPPKIKLGNLSIKRDFLDVREAVQAYEALLEMHSFMAGDIFNVCRGHAYSLKEIVDSFRQHTPIHFDVEQDTTHIRHNEPPIICGDPTKLQKHTKWSPTFTLNQSTYDMLQFVRGGKKE